MGGFLIKKSVFVYLFTFFVYPIFVPLANWPKKYQKPPIFFKSTVLCWHAIRDSNP